MIGIAISNTAGVPIYEQIKDQLKAGIVSGALAEGELLPSIRVLARDLRVSVITTTRAYADLTAEGFVANVPGKGYYVMARDTELIREAMLRDVERSLEGAIAAARLAGLTDAQLLAALDTLLKEER